MATEVNTKHLPKGTLEDLREANLDPMVYGCCHANGVGVMGCMVEKSCPFAQKKFGGFKGLGPEYVGYYHRTARADESKQHENVAQCFAFVQTLLRRMRKGAADKEEGRDYEHIEIIALPKSVIERAKANGDSEITRRFGDSVVVTRWTSEVPKSVTNMALVAETVEITVPEFARPQDNPGITHKQKLEVRAAERERRATREESGLPETREERLARIKAELAEMDAQLPAEPVERREVEREAEPIVEAFAEMPAASGDVPVAEPVVRKRG
jgi:hypothetical protein